MCVRLESPQRGWKPTVSSIVIDRHFERRSLLILIRQRV
jgi:hypothetical protein